MIRYGAYPRMFQGRSGCSSPKETAPRRGRRSRSWGCQDTSLRSAIPVPIGSRGSRGLSKNFIVVRACGTIRPDSWRSSSSYWPQGISTCCCRAGIFVCARGSESWLGRGSARSRKRPANRARRLPLANLITADRRRRGDRASAWRSLHLRNRRPRLAQAAISLICRRPCSEARSFCRFYPCYFS